MTVLFVIATILLFLVIDWIYLRATGKQAAPIPENERGVPSSSSIRIPAGIFFSPSHTWMHLYPSGKVSLGIDDFVGRMLEKPEVSYLKKTGEAVSKGDPILELREGGRKLTVRSPIDGEILTVNDDLRRQPELLRTELFNSGWAFTIRPQRFSDLKRAYLGGESKAWMRLEFTRLRDFFAGVETGASVAPALLQDGGPPVSGAMKSMSQDLWNRFEEEFLSVEREEGITR